MKKYYNNKINRKLSGKNSFSNTFQNVRVRKKRKTSAFNIQKKNKPSRTLY